MFEHDDDGIVTEMSVYVATDAPVKFVRLKLSNRSGRPRELSATAEHREGIRNFERPQCGNDKRVTRGETIEHRVGFTSGLSGMNPRDRDRGIGDEGTLHFRPCAIAERTSAAESAGLGEDLRRQRLGLVVPLVLEPEHVPARRQPRQFQHLHLRPRLQFQQKLSVPLQSGLILLFACPKALP